MNITPQRTEKIVASLCERGAEHCMQYGEPGYTPGSAGILFYNWNDVSKRIADYLEAAGYSLEWSDEWEVVYGEGKAYRTVSDSWFWEPRLKYDDDGEYLTPDTPPHYWIEWALDDASRALPSWFDDTALEEEGFSRYNAEHYEHGWHPGQTDDPKVIAKTLPDDVEFVFKMVEVSQFYIRFDLWTRHVETDSDAPDA